MILSLGYVKNDNEESLIDLKFTLDININSGQLGGRAASNLWSICTLVHVV